MRTIKVVAVAPVALGVVLAGCGGGKSSSSSASSPPATTSPGPAATSPTQSAATAMVITTKHNKKLGTILGAGPKRLTVYLFEGDTGRSSSCNGACASVWPPVTGKPTAAGAAMSSDIGTITRPDGTTQVTYKGHPLYFYVKDVKDGDPGDAYGEAIKSFGAEWYVLAPSGHKVDTS